MKDYGRFNESQRKALTAEGSVLVSASAGSGKTTVVIERILKLIKEERRDIKRMAVMTFSKAAASEMKNRLVKGLYETARSDSVPDAHVLKQLEAFPFANICTIDSFCYGLLKKYFAVIEADPSVKPLAPDESALIYDECVDRVCEEMLSNQDKAFISFAEHYTVSRRLDSVKEQIKELRSFMKVQPDPEKFFSESHDEAIENYFLKEFKRRAKAVERLCYDALPALREAGMADEETSALKILAFASELSKAQTCGAFFSAASCEPVKKCLKKKEIYLSAKDLFNRAAEAHKDFLEDVKKYGDKYYKDRNDEDDCRALVAVTLRAEALYSEKKKKEGKIDFDDMGAFALKLLADETVRQEIKDSFDYIFVDEYQDTNYLQEKLIEGISDGNIFAVGDVKQAIYQFRYAEPEIFNARMDSYNRQDDGQNILLNTNYRSRKEILDFVNMCCAEVMTEDFCNIDYRHGNMMSSGAEYKDMGSAVEIYLCADIEKKSELSGIYSVKDAETESDDDAESEFVAEYIARLLSGGERVFRPKKADFERIDYKDIAVLCRKKAECAEICRCLSARKIPFSIGDVSEGVFAPRELIVNFLRLCVSSPDTAVIDTMLSQLCNFTPAELMEIRDKAPKVRFWEAVNTYNEENELRNKIDGFLQYIDGLRNFSHSVKVSDMIVKILSDGLDGYFLSLGQETSSRIYKFLAAVKRLECDNDIRDFLEYYEESYKGEKPSARENSVTVMTLHKSKGLEFPVVIIPFIDKRSVGVGLNRTALFADRELGIALKGVDDEQGRSADTFATSVHKLKKQNIERQELARLMYVGFTRAENRLILTGKKLSGRDVFVADSFADFIGFAAEKNPLIKGLVSEVKSEKTDVLTDEPILADGFSDFSYLSASYRYEESVKRPNKYSVSEILERETGVVSPYAPTHKTAAAEEGTAYHLVMQRIPLTANGEDIRECVDSLVKSGEISVDTAKRLDEKKIAALLNSDIMKLAQRSKIYREQPFVFRYKTEEEDVVLVQGIVDLIIEEEDGITVADYKASMASPENLGKKYAKQLEIYAEAVCKIWQKPVKKRILFNILKNYELEV